MSKNANQDRTGLIASWIFGLYFFMLAMGEIFWPQNFFNGRPQNAICPAAISALLIPPFRQFFYKKTGITLSIFMRWLLIFVLFIVGAVIEQPHLVHQSKMVGVNAHMSAGQMNPNAKKQKTEKSQ
jgi:hypothetical protein